MDKYKSIHLVKNYISDFGLFFNANFLPAFETAREKQRIVFSCDL